MCFDVLILLFLGKDDYVDIDEFFDDNVHHATRNSSNPVDHRKEYNDLMVMPSTDYISIGIYCMLL